ncbi:hypothetical protein [Lacihabitans soyangensis]|uniref:Uncharacterized protein n=1 Tax=Lacihabitans soyangensis TaxID=869394 RepID=A0AAE3H2K0_9BACT|nr:hypothetical protein [Lacihabitans soyangensis]MCP9762796.1 hypothetical protein [Lacihabitans soyangensis]
MKEITLQYKKIIDKNAINNWDKEVWNETFLEYRMKSQYYDADLQFPLFQNLVLAKPEAVKLHYLTSLGCIGHIQRLNNLFPDVTDTLGNRTVPFVHYDFRILSADFNHKENFVIQLDFVSKPLLYLESIGENLLLGLPETRLAQKIDTIMVKLLPNLMINSLKYES